MDCGEEGTEAASGTDQQPDMAAGQARVWPAGGGHDGTGGFSLSWGCEGNKGPGHMVLQEGFGLVLEGRQSYLRKCGGWDEAGRHSFYFRNVVSKVGLHRGAQKMILWGVVRTYWALFWFLWHQAP